MLEKSTAIVAESDNCDKDYQPLSQCHLRPLDGQMISSWPALITRDEKYVLCCNGPYIAVYSVADSRRVHTLVGHTNDVTDIVFNPDNQFQVLSSSLDGSMKKWDYADAILLSTVTPSYTENESGNTIKYKSIQRMFNVGDNREMLFIMETEEGYSLIKQKAMFTNFADVNIIHKFPELLNPALVSVGYDGALVAVANMPLVNNNSAFWAIDLSTMKEKVHFGLKQWASVYGTRITAIAVHPSQPVVAAGLHSGRIFVAFLQKLTKVRFSYFHWHMYPVTALCFSPQGYHLYSGGSEPILPKWEVAGVNQRLGVYLQTDAPINSIGFSQKASTMVLGCADNSIKLVRENQIYREIQEVGEDFLCEINSSTRHQHFPSGIEIDPSNGSLVMNSAPGHLQFYSPLKRDLLSNLDITSLNYFRASDGHTTVDHVSFSPNGTWMVTFERWAGKLSHISRTISEQSRLKFWKFDDVVGMFKLNTDVNRPHTGGIACLRFSPLPDESSSDDCSVLVSTGTDDQKFKIWSLNLLDDLKGQMWWSVEKSGDYRQLGATAADFSDDATILAVAFGSKVTLWDVDTMTMLTSLPHQSDIISIRFSRGKSCQIMAVMGKNETVVWDLSTFTELQRIQGHGLALCIDPVTAFFAAITKTTGYILNAQGILGEFTIPEEFSEIHSAAFTTKSAVDSEIKLRQPRAVNIVERLYSVTRDGFVLEVATKPKPHTPTADEIGERLIAAADPSLSVTALGALLSIKRTDKDKSSAIAVQSTGRLQRDKLIEQIGETACIAMPNVSALCDSFLQCLVSGESAPQATHRRPTKPEEGDEMKRDDSDDETIAAIDRSDRMDTENSTPQTEVACDELKLLKFPIEDFSSMF